MNNPCDNIDPLGLDTCKFNVQLTNNAGLTADQINSVEQRIQQLFGATKSPASDSVGVNFSFSGKPDATLNIRNSPFFVPGSIFGVQGRGWNPTVFWDSARAYNSDSTTTFGGSVGAHELAHQFLAKFPWWGSSDLSYDKNSANMMMFDSAPDLAQLDAVSNPASPLWRFSPSQVATLFSKCRSAHPSQSSSGGGGGDGGGGVSGPGVGWTYGTFCGVWGGEGGGCSTVITGMWFWPGSYIPPHVK